MQSPELQTTRTCLLHLHTAPSTPRQRDVPQNPSHPVEGPRFESAPTQNRKSLVSVPDRSWIPLSANSPSLESAQPPRVAGLTLSFALQTSSSRLAVASSETASRLVELIRVPSGK